MGKSILGLIIAVVLTVVAANLAFRANSSPEFQASKAPWAQDRMEFVAWNGNRWTAWINDDKFEHVPEVEGKWHRHANRGIAYIDWSGEPWQAKVDGNEFLIAYRGDWSGQTERVTAIKYQDWMGRNQLRTVDQLSR